ncbi:testis-expressed protein 30-like [Liolophura sinensis]|uniref:testis-expressed protein 30-like n=1 Tax=Liolophura sinensis TaxID=3198878 RepID=UPI00315863EF
MATEIRLLTLVLDGGELQACLSIPLQIRPEYGMLLTHGAGGSMDSAELPALASHLASHGLICLRFTCKGLNLNYRVKMYQQVLEKFQSVIEFPLKGIFLAGRSMGSRAAVMVANNSKGTQLYTLIKGVICLSYPLIGSGKGDLRDAPLLQLNHPSLFVSGDRDPMCPKEKMLSTLRQCDKTHSIHWIQGAGHGFSDTKGMRVLETIQAVCDQVGSWCGQICSGHLDTVAPVGCEGEHPLVSLEAEQSCDMKERDGRQERKRGQKSSRKFSVSSSESSCRRNKTEAGSDSTKHKKMKCSADPAVTNRLRSRARTK